MDLVKNCYASVDESEAKSLAVPRDRGHPVEVFPPRSGDVPATLDRFLRGLLEIQTKILGTGNASPVVSYEIIRYRQDRLRLQFYVPTERLERKVRTHLTTEIPDIGFEEGVHTIPLERGDEIGGGLLTTGRQDRFPLRTDFDSPPVNSLVGVLHRHAMRDSRFFIQILFQPVAGRPLSDWWWKRRSYKTSGFLRKQKEDLWGGRSPTSREREQADLVERKAGTRRYRTCIRFAVMGAGEQTRSRVKEVAGGFNVFENPDSGQYLDMHTVTGRRRKPFFGFYRSIRDREFGGYSLDFQSSIEELAGLVSVPDREQENLKYAL